jgi:PAS domain S-box-containing protein
MSGPDSDETASRLAAILEASDAAILSLDLDGTIVSWNPAAERIFGFSPAEAVGQSIRIIIPPDQHAEADAVLSRVRRGEAVERFETIRRRKDGQQVAVAEMTSPIRAGRGRIVGVSTIAHDLRGRDRAERAARRLAAIVESSDDAIVSKNLDGYVTSWNSAAERMFGYSAAEMVGESIRLLIPADRQAEEDDVLGQIRQGRRVDHFETIRVRKDRSLIPISLTVSPIRDGDGKIVGVSKIARDISDRKAAEAERAYLLAVAQEHAAENARLYVGVQEASRLKDEFLATLSHELRTPLNAILGYARMIRSGLLVGEKHLRAIDTIERNATSLTQIVEDVLDVSRIITGKVRLNVQMVDLPGVVQNALESVTPAAAAKGVNLETVLDPRGGPIAGDPDRLQQVVWNLVSNAVKFTHRGGRVHVRLERIDSHVEVVVSDTGIGIEPDFLPHVFERFRQADSGPTRQLGGLGLGLAVARHFIELHGGSIQATSGGRGMGSTFQVTLPLSLGPQETQPEPHVRPPTEHVLAQIAVPNLEGVHVLAVDDDDDALRLVCEILESTGARVSTATTALDAIAAIETRRPDVMVADLGLPQVDGFELIARVRRSADEAVRRMPAAALTAYARSEDRAKALRCGFQMHLSKPIDPAELMAAVAALMKRTRVADLP